MSTASEFAVMCRDGFDDVIEQLDHTQESVAEEIYALFQASYRVEASLIGVENFPPLRRTTQGIACSGARFWGRRHQSKLVGAIEVETDGVLLDVSSLVVAPQSFGTGIGESLLRYVLVTLPWRLAQVQTAVANIPAAALYGKVGFSEEKRWVGEEGIELVSFLKEQPHWPGDL